MKLRLLGSVSKDGDSPTLYETDRDTYVFQGWKVTDHEAQSHMRIPGNETCVEVPKALLMYLPKGTHGVADG